jgi:hypothetical protein
MSSFPCSLLISSLEDNTKLVTISLQDLVFDDGLVFPAGSPPALLQRKTLGQERADYMMLDRTAVPKRHEKIACSRGSAE